MLVAFSSQSPGKNLKCLSLVVYFCAHITSTLKSIFPTFPIAGRNTDTTNTT